MAIDERTFDVHGEYVEAVDPETGVEHEYNDAPDFDVKGFLAAKEAEERREQKRREEEARMAAMALIRYRLDIDN